MIVWHHKQFSKGNTRRPPGKRSDPLLLNFAMAALPSAMAVYVDDIWLWCIVKFTQAQVIRARSQESISSVSIQWNELSLIVSPTKT